MIFPFGSTLFAKETVYGGSSKIILKSYFNLQKQATPATIASVHVSHKSCTRDGSQRHWHQWPSRLERFNYTPGPCRYVSLLIVETCFSFSCREWGLLAAPSKVSYVSELDEYVWPNEARRGQKKKRTKRNRKYLRHTTCNCSQYM